MKAEVRRIASCNILAVNSNPLEDKDFCFVMKLASYRSTCTARGPKPPKLKFNNLFNEHFPSYFFKSIFCA